MQFRVRLANKLLPVTVFALNAKYPDSHSRYRTHRAASMHQTTRLPLDLASGPPSVMAVPVMRAVFGLLRANPGRTGPGYTTGAWAFRSGLIANIAVIPILCK